MHVGTQFLLLNVDLATSFAVRHAGWTQHLRKAGGADKWTRYVLSGGDAKTCEGGCGDFVGTPTNHSGVTTRSDRQMPTNVGAGD
eukprot:scaffold51055_cov22-Prasinocladus_malaysianus.AAC.1